MAANRSYFPAANSRRTFWKACVPGNAQKRSMGPSTSSSPLTVTPSASVGRHWAPARISWVLDSSSWDQLSLRTCHRLLYARAFASSGTVTTSVIRAPAAGPAAPGTEFSQFGRRQGMHSR